MNNELMARWLDDSRARALALVNNLHHKLEQRLAPSAPPETMPERALILPFDPHSPSTRAVQVLRLNALPVQETRDEPPTESFLPALHKLATNERRATLSEALSRHSFVVKSKR
ncbi:MAG: hypothetical protein HYR56_29860 [Acidobacteria bacterium]|nr:hypothetical protein [Acidobacteriota bacterium]MBI3422769.1 hypothetical protein [Acidobacteriota bacterium]